MGEDCSKLGVIQVANMFCEIHFLQLGNLVVSSVITLLSFHAVELGCVHGAKIENVFDAFLHFLLVISAKW